MKIRYSANQDRFYAGNNPVAEEIEPEYSFYVLVHVFL